ncbi:MAG: hypothetical protein QW314_05775 [Thermoproteota archaeon]|nr:hypothetical protein [Candidatus Brockarchaeota archaeon]
MGSSSYQRNISLVFIASVVFLILFSAAVYLYPGNSNSDPLEAYVRKLKIKIKTYYNSGDIASELVYKNLVEKLDQIEKTINEKNQEKTVDSLFDLLRYINENEGRSISYQAAEDLRSIINNLIFNVAKHL